MIINTSKSSLPHAATLASELYVPLTHTQCLTFWYHLSTDSGEHGSLAFGSSPHSCCWSMQKHWAVDVAQTCVWGGNLAEAQA